MGVDGGKESVVSVPQIYIPFETLSKLEILD
jgi:hypothetical protein